MSTESTNLALKDTAVVPEHLKALGAEFAGAGMEEVRTQDLVLPRMLLMQAMSPEVADTGKFKAGDLVDQLEGALIAESGKPVKMMVIKHFLQWIRWRDRKEGGGVIESQYDPNSDLAKEFASYDWRDKDKKKDIVEYHNFVIILPEVDPNKMLVVSCGKTNHKHGKNLITKIKMRGSHLPAFAGLYEVKSVNEKNKDGDTYKVYEFTNQGWASPEWVEFAKVAYQAVGKKKIAVNQDAADGAVESGHSETEI
jgi:hypothetical protein